MKKVSLIFTIAALILLSHASLSAQTFEWALRSNTNLFATGGDVATDPQGNCYVTGTYLGKVKFGDNELISIGGRDIYLVKYDVNGNVLWAKGIGSTVDDFGNAVAVDKEGNCYLAGAFALTLRFATDSLKAKGQHDMFLAKYNSKGDLLWCRSAGGYYEDHAMAVSLDKVGNCYMAGYFKDTVWFAGKPVGGRGALTYNSFLAKYDAGGNFLWGTPIGGSNYASPNEGLAIATEPDGVTYVTGYYAGEGIFDLKLLSTRGMYGFYLAKYGSDGKVIWVKSSGNDRATVMGKAVALDEDGNCYVSGTFTSRTTFDTISIISRNIGYPDMFLAKYNGEGNVQWVRPSTGFGVKTPYDMTVDNDGNPYLYGLFRDTAIFDNLVVTAKGTESIFLVKYDPKGEPQWAKQVGRHGVVIGKAIGIDKAGDIFMTGHFTDSAEFGKAHIIANPNTQDMFFAKLSPHSLVKETKLPDSTASDFTFISCDLESRSKWATVKFSIPKPMFVLLEVDDLLGNVAESFVEGQRSAGVYEMKLDLRGIKEGGEYHCRLQAGNEKLTKKMTLTR